MWVTIEEYFRNKHGHGYIELIVLLGLELKITLHTEVVTHPSTNRAQRCKTSAINVM